MLNMTEILLLLLGVVILVGGKNCPNSEVAWGKGSVNLKKP